MDCVVMRERLQSRSACRGSANPRKQPGSIMCTRAVKIIKTQPGHQPPRRLSRGAMHIAVTPHKPPNASERFANVNAHALWRTLANAAVHAAHSLVARARRCALDMMHQHCLRASIASLARSACLHSMLRQMRARFIALPQHEMLRQLVRIAC